jgi:hypothetical protein
MPIFFYRHSIIPIVLLALLFSGVSLDSIENHQPGENHSIDWIAGRIYSSIEINVTNDHNFASNRLSEINIAREKAKVNYYSILQKINIRQSQSVLDYIETSGDKNRDLFTLIDNATLYKLEYPDLNSIRLTYYINLYGDDSLMNIMMSESNIYTESLRGYMGYHYDTRFSGMIIDARGTLTSFAGKSVKVKPAFFLTIKDNEGITVFNRNNVFLDVIRNHGMVQYSYNINDDHSPRVGTNPLRISAYMTGDESGSVLVVTEENAKRMLASADSRNALQNGRIVIVIDK